MATPEQRGHTASEYLAVMNTRYYLTERQIAHALQRRKVQPQVVAELLTAGTAETMTGKDGIKMWRAV